ncbi:SANT domain-containing protein [Xylariales sp. AK1849]|nr:SANT domain-containing protein [Xylariales sp. AK1849]
MAPKSQNASGADDPPNPASSATKDAHDSVSSHTKSVSHTNSPATAQSALVDAPENAAGSEPMTKSTSTGSDPSAKEAMSGPSPYGTRSRNRGQPRPNYAEDKDADTEMYDAYPDKKQEDPKKPPRQAVNATNGALDAPRASGSTSRKAASTEESKGVNPHVASKDQISGSAAPAATTALTTSTSSKKRKATTQSATNGTHSHSAAAPTHTSTTAANTRRSTAHAVPAGHTGAGYRESNMLSFEDCGAKPRDGKMVADDGTVLQRNDHVYLVCEPPGEPYYLGRIMEFLHVQNDSSNPVDALRINWYYRPKDIGKRVNDTRLVFATMHSDTSPLTALRGKCQIRHKAEIQSMDEYRKTPDCFWFEKLYDRYIQKHYDVVPCSQIVNVPEKVKRVLDERWKFILVEQGRSKEFTSAVKSCKRCSGYCASNDSVDCAVCQQTYHMNCVRPPLLKKPSRGFAWACAACSRAQERKLEARHTPSLLDPHPEEEEEYWDEEEDDHGAGTNRTSPDDGIDDTHQPATAEQMYQASLWPYRYLGIHCKPEDALDYDDRIYPRAGSRQGPKHQATVLPWPGCPVTLVKPLEIKKSSRKDGKPSKETLAAIEADKIAREKRPKWIQDEPPGYVARGEDYDDDDPRNSAQLLWKPVDTVGVNTTAREIDKYMENAVALAPSMNLPKQSTNLMDVARDALFLNKFDITKSLKTIPKVDRAEFKEPELNAVELKKFEEGVAKFGSELYHVKRHVRTVEHKNIVRFYYTWKKTDRGKQVWGNYTGRKGKKEAKKAEANASKLQDDVADDHDDSAFDTEKALERKRNFTCKFCNTKSSRQWRRAPNVSSALVTEGSGKNKDKGAQYVVALCRRCAELWRRYAIQWEDVEELSKKIAAAGGRAWKRRVDEELIKELAAANEMMSATVYTTPTLPATQTTATAQAHASDPPRKKLKAIADKDAEPNASDSGSMSGIALPKKKDKVAEKPAPPPVPEIPKPRVLPCAICNQIDPTGEQHHLSCKECRLSVHRKCYGVVDNRHAGKWTCDMCLNDKNPQVSLEYKCVLCPVDFTEHEFVEPPKNSHKKKTEKEKEKDRLEREAAQKAADYYRKKQEDTNRPVNPREPLKRTADNNWVHVTCAVWAPEVKFGSAKALGPSEGIPSIPRVRYDEVCKACKQKGGACAACHQCKAPVHVECAHKSGYLLGFEVSPVKGSRRDQFNIVTINGETGAMSAAIWCKEHIPTRTVVHRMHDIVNQPETQSKDPSVLNALQLYVQNFKQADLALTGTVRKANLIAMATKTPAAAPPTNINRRASTTTASANGYSTQRAASIDGQTETTPTVPQSGDKICITCGIDVSPKWWPIEKSQEKVLINGHYGSLGSEAQKFVDQRNFQCHKCKKADRKPVAHAPPPSAEAVPQLEPNRAPPALAAALTSPPPTAASESRAALAQFSWAPPAQAAAAAAAPPPGPPPVAVPPIQAPLAGPPPPPPPNTPHHGPSPMAAPITQPPPSHHYPPQSTPYSDWHRSTIQHSPPLHHINGGPGGPNPLHMNHLRDLRPPPIAPIPHHQAPPLRHDSIGQPMATGIPPSSPRRVPPVQNGAAPYLPSYHHQTHHSLQNLTNGGPPPQVREHAFSQGLLGQRSPFSTPQGSPPLSRDGLTRSREPSLSNNPPPPPRPNDGRPASGASASPSLRNLLS